MQKVLLTQHYAKAAARRSKAYHRQHHVTLLLSTCRTMTAVQMMPLRAARERHLRDPRAFFCRYPYTQILRRSPFKNSRHHA